MCWVNERYIISVRSLIAYIIRRIKQLWFFLNFHNCNEYLRINKAKWDSESVREIKRAERESDKKRERDSERGFKWIVMINVGIKNAVRGRKSGLRVLLYKEWRDKEKVKFTMYNGEIENERDR